MSTQVHVALAAAVQAMRRAQFAGTVRALALPSSPVSERSRKRSRGASSARVRAMRRSGPRRSPTAWTSACRRARTAGGAGCTNRWGVCGRRPTKETP